MKIDWIVDASTLRSQGKTAEVAWVRCGDEARIGRVTHPPAPATLDVTGGRNELRNGRTLAREASLKPGRSLQQSHPGFQIVRISLDGQYVHTYDA